MYKNSSLLIIIVVSIFLSIFAEAKLVLAQKRQKLEFETCLDSSTWIRPSEKEQISFIKTNVPRRYGNPPFDRLLDNNEWQNNVLVLPAFPGGSGIYDHSNLSGLWSLPPDLKTRLNSCYKKLNTSGPNSSIFQVQLFSYKIQGITWTGSRYELVVKPSNQGLQVVNVQGFPYELNIASNNNSNCRIPVFSSCFPMELVTVSNEFAHSLEGNPERQSADEEKKKSFPVKKSQIFLGADEYIPYHPIGCARIEKSKNKGKTSYFKIVCSRGGEERQEVSVVKTKNTGVIDIGEGRYWCSGEASGLKHSGRAGICTKDGWVPKNITVQLLSQGTEKSKRGDYQGAEQDFTEAININPRLARAYYFRGILRSSKLNELDNGILDFNKAIELNLNLTPIYYYRGLAYFNRKEDTKAIKDLTHVISSNQIPAGTYLFNVHFFRGLARLRQGNSRSALEDLSKAIKVKPNSAEAYFYRATARYGLKDEAGATEDLNNAKKLDPNIVKRKLKESNLQ